MLLVNTDIYCSSILKAQLGAAVCYMLGILDKTCIFQQLLCHKHLLLKHIDKMPVGYNASLAFGN